MELAEQTGCYVWNPELQPDETVRWTGECLRELAQGAGTLKAVWINDGSKKTLEAMGSLKDGKQHGDWVYRHAGGDAEEGPYVDGKRHGRWVTRSPERIHRRADGSVRRELVTVIEEGPYVDGQQHGHWVFRTPNRTFRTPDKTVRLANGTERLVEGIERDVRGYIRMEGPYVDGKQHGNWVTYYDGKITSEGSYVDGKKHGRWRERRGSSIKTKLKEYFSTVRLRFHDFNVTVLIPSGYEWK